MSLTLLDARHLMFDATLSAQNWELREKKNLARAENIRKRAEEMVNQIEEDYPHDWSFWAGTTDNHASGHLLSPAAERLYNTLDEAIRMPWKVI